MGNKNQGNLDYLYKCFVAIKKDDESRKIIEDLFTTTEAVEFSNRLYAARLLKNGKTYNEVASLTGLSSATISRVNKCLKHGDGGYNTIIDRIDGSDE